MVAAHSGALAGEDGAWQALFDAYGVMRVRTMDELADTCELLLAGRVAAAGGLAAVLDSGGERAHLVDLAEEAGVAFAPLAPATERRLGAVLDPGLAPVNPVDATPIPLCAPGVPSTPESPCRALKDETSPDGSQQPSPWAGRTTAVCPYSSVHQHHVDPNNPQSPFDENVDDTRHDKYQPAQATTKIERIIVQVGRTGALTPVAEMTPVELAGVKVSRATRYVKLA